MVRTGSLPGGADIPLLELGMDPAPPALSLRDRWSQLVSTPAGVRRVVAGMALTGLVLAGTATVIVWNSARGHRDTAETLLLDQANFLATQYANSAQTESWYAVRAQLHAWGEVGHPGRPFPTPSEVLHRVEASRIGPALASFVPEAWFRIDRGSLRALPNGGRQPLRGTEWQAAITAALARRPLEPERFGYLVTADARVLFYHEDQGGIAGFVIPLDQWRQVVFLPLAERLRLGHDSTDQTVVSVRVTAPDGSRVFETDTPLEEPACVGEARMTGSLSSLVQVTYPESGVDLVIPGGLPAPPARTAGTVLLVLLVALGGVLVVVHRALALAQLRSEFTSTISHELRTPLTQILLYAETLGRDRPLAPAQRAGALEVIVRETRRLVQMVENILALSRVGRPELRVVRRPERVDRLVDEVLAGFEPMFRARRITAEVRGERPLEAEVDADAVRQVLINLVDNAVRHGPEGQTLTVAALRANGGIELAVSDEGPGIPAADRERIWAPFVRGAPGAGSAGSGIGLAVVRQLATLHGGTARVEALPGGGARFRVTLAVDGTGGT